MKYESVIGLEVHVELSTETKMFCSCKNEFGAEVNTHVCPICLAMPGTLPALNGRAVEYAVKAGLATNCKIAPVSKQDRKNYFYPDLSKAYQISQYDMPICHDGYLDVNVDGGKKRIRLNRIHIEEDAGKLLHEGSEAYTLLDDNRGGVPLIEIVTEPDIRTSAEAKAFLESIRSILQSLDVSDCKMQEGSIRCDVNVSIMPEGSDVFGTRVEMKNVNTFSGAVRGIEYEIKRQSEVLDSGGTIFQETRRWDDDRGVSYAMRSKENAQDYRYFPDPDLVTIRISEEDIERLRAEIPELPHDKYDRYIGMGLSEYEAGLISDAFDRSVFFDGCMELGGIPAKTVSNWLLGDIAKELNDRGIEIGESNLTPEKLAALLKMVADGKVSGSAAKKVLEIIFDTGNDPAKIVERENLGLVSDEGTLESIVDEVLAANEKSVVDYRNGKTNALGFLVGQCMKASKGQGNPQLLNEMLRKKLEE